MTEARPPRPRQPDPIAWPAVEALAGRAQELAKGWLLALLERSPLDAVGAIPAAALASEGPGVCDAFVRALGSDVELDRLRPGGDRAALAARIGPLAGARDVAERVAAVDALRACVWAAARAAQGEAVAAEIDALAERVATVAAVVTASAVAAEREDAAPFAPAAPRDGAAAPADGPAASPDGASPTGWAAPDAPDAPDGPDARAPATDAGGRDGASVTPLPARPTTDPASTMDDGDLWLATLERHIDRCQREGGGLALLRVELVDGERVAATATDEQEGVPYGRLAQAIRQAIRRQDLVAADREGRAWVIAPGVGRAGAVALAERIAAGVERGESWRGGPLAATIGFAIYGEDGQDAATLIDRAEEAMLAASAAGLRIGEAIPHPGGAGRPPGPHLIG